MAFPLSPSNGQQYTSGGFTYQYNSTLKTWTKVASTGSNIGNVSLANATVTAGNTTLSTTGLTTGTTSVSNTSVTVGNTSVTTTAVTVGNTSVTTTSVSTGTISLTANLTVGNSVIDGNSVFIGNSSANTSITSTGLTTGTVTTTGISISGNIIPTANVTYNLGTADHRWKDLFLSGNTIDLGGGTLEIVGNTFVITNPAGGTFTIDGNVAISSQVLAQLDAGNLSQVNAIGILNLLNVTGNITTNSAINANQVYANSGTIGNLIVGGNISIGNVVGNISFKDGQVDLGPVTNVHISGGSSGQYLKTDGSGNLTWSTVSGGGAGGATSPGGSNTQLQFNDADSFAGDANLTYNKTTSTLSVSNVSISNNANISGNLGVTGNISGNNITITGNVSAANITATTFTGNLAGSSNTSITVSGNAQPNITSLGTLVNLAVSGNVLFSGANVTLGDVSNIHITGGSTGQVITTDGTGNLTWITVGNATTAGTNTQIQFNNGGSLGASANLTFDTTSNTLTVTNIVADGTGLTSLAGANVSGQVGNALVSGTVYTNAQPNITSVGTLTSLSVTGNITGSYIIGNGSQLTGLPAGYTDTNANSAIDARVTKAFVDNLAVVADISNVAYSVSGANVSGQVGNALVAGTVYTNAQPNITSVGTLSSIIVDGVTTLGSISNVIITGGTTGQYLKTDGTGNLSWSDVSGGGGGGSLTITDDTTTDIAYYPVYATSSSGSMSIAGISTTKLQFNPSSGQLTVQDLNTLSDATLKSAPEDIADPFTVLSQLFGVGFSWLESGKKSYGLMAQNVEKVLPELVNVNAQGKKTVNYIPIIAFLLEAVKKQQTDIDALKNK